VSVIEAQHAEVEQLVVQAAEGEAVVRFVGAVEGEPPYVRGVDSNGRAGELTDASAEGTLAVPFPTTDVHEPPAPPAAASRNDRTAHLSGSAPESSCSNAACTRSRWVSGFVFS
jgi:hypothetical protein